MLLNNLTPFAVHLFRGSLDEVEIFAIIACRVTCRITHEGALEPLPTQPPVREHPEESPLGPLEEDAAPIKPGVDVVVLGDAIAPSGPVPELPVSLRVGEAVRTLLVKGDRRWVPAPGVDIKDASARSREGEEAPDALVPSAPQPFERMPLTLDRAFGGVTETPAGDAMYVDNPHGRGFYHFLDRAAGGLLPNLEDPDQPMRSWMDHPDPVGIGPLPRACRLRMERGHALHQDTREVEILPEYYLMAPPQQVFERLDPGTVVAVEGMYPYGAVWFRVPELDIRADVKVGEDRQALPCLLDTVEVWPNELQAAFVLRTSFRYPVNKGEARSVVVELAAPPRFR